MQRFMKIKHDAKGVELVWSTTERFDTVEHKLSSSETPRRELKDALMAFVPEVLRLLELPTHYEHGLVVTGLTIKEGKDDDGRSLIVTCQKTIDDSEAPLILNTPLMPDADTGAIGALLDSAEDAAENYRRGRRAQADLFEDGGISSVTISSPGSEPVTLTSEELSRAGR
jgi:hypothetical protein